MRRMTQTALPAYQKTGKLTDTVWLLACLEINLIVQCKAELLDMSWGTPPMETNAYRSRTSCRL